MRDFRGILSKQADWITFLWQRMECNYYCKESGRIAEALFNAKENPNENDFPDFIVESGFIEHFTVSAAKENRHGSEYRKIDKEINKKWQSEFETKKRNSSNQFILQIR